MSSSYDVGERVFEGARSSVFRARRRADGMPVILKRLRDPHPTPALLAALAREVDITAAVAGEGVIAVLEHSAEDGLVVEDFGARSLAMILRERRFGLSEALRLGVQIADALARVHHLDVVHRDVNPSNIVLNEATGVARLIDFGIAQVLTRETTQTFEGTPRYVSPEQTGRMNRPIDHRSDLYSLGVTLYELLTGAPPFDARGRLELVHAHIARTPVPPHEIDPQIPISVSRIVTTLLQKQAEQRYLGARGLRHDLARCLEQIGEGTSARAFTLRQKDIDERLRIPQALYGREREVATLSDACAEAVKGRARMLFVAGYSGIGKTSLVREVRRLLAGGRARMVEGKYDQFRRGQPYSGFLHALGDLVRQLLAEPDDVVAGVRARIVESVGGNGRVLVDLVEELASVIGAQPEVEVLPPAESKNRLQLAIVSLLRALATPERPLVLFLDDLQCADLPSFELIERVVCDPSVRHVLVLGAYRDNEVGPDHALFAAARAMEAAAAEVETITLGPLGEEDVMRLVSDAVYAAPGHLRLAAACHDRTRGNAFYLNRFLESLYEDELLRFDPSSGHWRWDLDGIAARPVTENVVDFLAGRIRKLPDADRACLLDASAIGDRFDLDTLAAARGATRKDTLDALAGAIRAELVQPDAEGFWYVRAVDEAHTNFGWRFAHDRIRQAASELLDGEGEARVHLRVGRHLLARLSPAERESRVFELASHLQAARPFLDSGELRVLEELQCLAGRRALASAAFDGAHAILSLVIADLPADAWELRYEATLAVHLDAARAAWLSGHREAMETLVATARDRARSSLDQVAAREIEIAALVGQERLGEAVSTALSVLEALGVSFPTSPTEADVGAALASTLAAVEAAGAGAIAALPEVADERVAVAMRIQSAIMSSAYLARPGLFPFLTCSLVATSLRHGLTRQSPYGFAVFALVLNVIDRLDTAHTLGDVALALLDRWDDRAVRARTEHVVYNQVKSYTEPLRPTLDAQMRVFRLAMETGDLEYAAWALQCVCCNGFYAGLDLVDLGERVTRHVATMRQHQQRPALACSTPWAQLIENLVSGGDAPARLVGPAFDEAVELAAHRASNFRGAACVVTTAGIFSRYVFRDLEGAVSWADAGAEFLDGAGSTYHVVWWHQYRALAHLGQGGAPAAVAESRAKLATWSRFSPGNHRHRLELVDAEIARAEGRVADAMASYDAAISAARAGRFLHEEALANELAGRFYQSRGVRTAARAYLGESAWLWRRWGALAKATHLEAEFPELLDRTRALGAVDDASTSWGASTTAPSGGLDLDTLFKAASAISGEIHLDRLLARILEVAIENAGATRGLLLLDHDGALRVDASLSVGSAPRVAAGTALADCPSLAANVVSYVARAGQPVLVADAREDARWQGSARFTADQPTSVLCVPVAHKGIRTGIVYLENDLASGAFGEDRARVLALLASQAAVSIENARLYRNLESSLETQVRLTNAHRRFVPHPFLESLARKDISEITLGDSVRKEMTVLFADMRGFTRRVAGMSGSESIEFINTYLGRMEPPVDRHGGFVDSYVGDAIMALFEHADAALQAALGMQAALASLNADLATPIEFGLGIDTGELTLGTIGTENRVKCGVIGDCVNVASRVESLTRSYDVPFLTTDRTRARLRRRYDLRFVDRVVVKGHTEAVRVFEIFDADPAPIREAKLRVATRYERAIGAYYARDFGLARSLFDECRAELPSDRVLALFVERCTAHLVAPPPDGWDGVELLLHK